MTAFANYNFYENEYLCEKEAVIDIASSYFYFQKATFEIKQYIGNNLKDNNPAKSLQHCCCAVAEILFYKDKSNHHGISSEKVGDLSVSYENAEQATQVMRNEIKQCVYSYLNGTGLLYMGVR